MARMDKMEVFSKMGETGMVPVFYDGNADRAKAVVEACRKGGVCAFEFTNRGDFAHEVFAELSRFVSESCPGMSLGAGSVVDPGTASLYMQLGADFIVGPLFNPEVAKVCNRRGVPYLPGCGSVTEVGFAQEAGCEVVKVFPGDVLGPKFVKGLMAPMPWTKVMVTGGVEPTKENLEGWFGAGAFCVGMGSKLFPKAVLNEGRWEEISARCRDCIEIIKDCRKP